MLTLLGTVVWADGTTEKLTGARTAKLSAQELRQAEQHYGNAIKGLEQIASANQNALDPNTAATLQKNLAVIDQAINESRAAVRAREQNSQRSSRRTKACPTPPSPAESGQLHPMRLLGDDEEVSVQELRHY